MPAEAHGNYAVSPITAGNTGYFNGYMPYDLGNLLEIAIVFIADADDATFDYSITAAFGTDTENYDQHTAGPLADQMVLVNDVVYEISVISLFGNISRLDAFGIALASGGGNQKIYLLGTRVKYLPNKPVQSGTVLVSEFFVNASVAQEVGP